MDYLYPRLYKLDYTSATWGQVTDEMITLPDRLPLSGASLSHDHLFLMTGPSGYVMMMIVNDDDDERLSIISSI